MHPLSDRRRRAEGQVRHGLECRDAAYSMVAGIDRTPSAGQLKEWATPYWKGVHPYDLAGAYTNFMMGGDGEERIKISFGDNYPRLKALNAKYDPTNLSRVNQSVRPAD
jgi:Berberine and berberine like